MTAAGKDVGKWKFAHLACGGLDQAFLAVCKAYAPKPCEPVDKVFSVAVVDIDSLAAFEDVGADFPVPCQVRVGVDEGFDVA